MPKWLKILIAVFLGYFLITAPQAAAAKAHSGLDGLKQAGTSLSKFVNAL